MTWSSLLDDARAAQPDLVRLRRAIHQEPEIGLDNPRTQEKVLTAIDGLGLETDLGRALTSVVAVVRGAAPGPSVLLRADLDALPLTEPIGLPYAARLPGAMHACGHDLHAAMLVGAARLLAARRDRLAGDVVLMFQPGEEGHDGAARMLEEGLLEAAGARPVAAYALHVGTARLGSLSTRCGPALAASGTVEVVLRGRGGHGAWPQAARDPVPALCETVLALQAMVTRRFDVFDPVVLSVGALSAGTAANILPETAAFTATVRWFSDEARERLRTEITRVCEGVASAHGLDAAVDFVVQYPVTVNDDAEARFVGETARELFGAERFALNPRPAMVSDDIGRVLARVPGVMVGLGAAPPELDPVTAAPNHSPLVRFDDAVLADGAALLAGLALSRLRGPEPT